MVLIMHFKRLCGNKSCIIENHGLGRAQSSTNRSRRYKNDWKKITHSESDGHLLRIVRKRKCHLMELNKKF